MTTRPEQGADDPSRTGTPLWSYGLRPFFLGAGGIAVVAVPAWLAMYLGWLTLPSPLGPMLWHGHEMLFGYSAAVLAGFLLTATPSWSRRPPLVGRPLVLLAALWLAGRLAMWSGEALPLAAAVLDFAFLPALAVAITPALQSASRRNLVFLPLLTCLAAANLGVHLDALGVLPGLGWVALRLALDLFALLIGLIGGRIVPAFTGNALRANGIEASLRPSGWLDRLALATLLLLLVFVDLFAPPWLTGLVALCAGLTQLLRMHGWQTRRTLDQPILWVLHLGYAWLGLGLIWRGVIELSGLLPPQEALHGIAIGAIGTMTMAVMSRAALGHTGRPLVVHPAITLAYALVSGAAVARLVAALLPWSTALLITSGTLWTLAFALFVGVYAPILAAPRADVAP